MSKAITEKRIKHKPAPNEKCNRCQGQKKDASQFKTYIDETLIDQGILCHDCVRRLLATGTIGKLREAYQEAIEGTK